MTPADELLRSLPQYARQSAMSEIESPNWESIAACGDWKAYVPPEVAEIWPHLSVEARLVAYHVGVSRTLSEG